MRTFLLLALLLPMTWVDTAQCQFWSAELGGWALAPPTNSQGTGVVSAYCWWSSDCPDSLSFQCSGHFRSLTGYPIAIALCRGTPGTGSEILHTLAWLQAVAGRYELRDTTLVLSAEECLDLSPERLHVLVATDSFPSGEIAGIVRPRPDPVRNSSWGQIRAIYR